LQGIEPGEQFHQMLLLMNTQSWRESCSYVRDGRQLKQWSFCCYLPLERRRAYFTEGCNGWGNQSKDGRELSLQQDRGLFHDKFSSAVHRDGFSTALCAAHMFCHCLHLPAGRHSWNALSCKYTCATNQNIYTTKPTQLEFTLQWYSWNALLCKYTCTKNKKIYTAKPTQLEFTLQWHSWNALLYKYTCTMNQKIYTTKPTQLEFTLQWHSWNALLYKYTCAMNQKKYTQPNLHSLNLHCSDIHETHCCVSTRARWTKKNIRSQTYISWIYTAV
jgi:hypothetical protein